jgi:hypothetical protein
MPSGSVRSFASLFALVALVVSSGATIFGIMQEGSNTVLAEDYIIPAALGSTIAVIFLIILTATIPSRSILYKLFVIVVLIVGLVAEIYLTVYVNKMPASVATYIVIVLNFLIRAFYVLEYVQDEWAPLYTTPSVSEIVKQIQPQKQPQPQSRPVESDEDSLRKEFISKFDKIKNKLRDSPEGLMKDSSDEAWRTVMRPALESKTFTIEKLKEAAGKLKHDDGSPVSVSALDIRGGRKR